MAHRSDYYTRIRKERGLSREKASELMTTISPEKLEKIENGKQEPTPADIMEMAQGYGEPSIRNYYCAHDCPLGQHYVPEVKFKDLEKTVLQMIASLNSMHTMQERLIAISADGKVDENEIRDFIIIRRELERISAETAAMQLWVEKMLAAGTINNETYNRILLEFEEEEQNSAK
jgi:transcriptional regulator with XRE-family HTH domain